MDDQRLRQQYEETGDLLDVLDDPEFLREMIEAEDACGGAIGAGFPAYSLNPKPVEPALWKQAMKKVRLQSILFTELESLMQASNLGSGTEAAITEARRRIRYQLTQLNEEQQAFFTALVEEDHSQPAELTLHSQVKSRLCSLLTASDWSAIGQAATDAIQIHWNEFIQSSKTA
jgi:hypothetical protein